MSLKRSLLIGAVATALACGDQVLTPTPEELRLLGPTADVEIVRVLPDTPSPMLRMEIEPAQCFDLSTGVPNPAAEVSEDWLFSLGSNGRLTRVSRGDFRSGRRVRIWASPDGCGTYAAAALLAP